MEGVALVFNVETGERYIEARTYPDKTLAKIQAEAKQRLITAIQGHLDSKAQERGYDNIFTACTYAGDPNPTWNTEGTAFKAWRSAVWQYCLTVLADIEAGTRAIPTESELIAELPALSI